MSHHSIPLDRMINGEMAEAQRGYAVLNDVDQGTFERFIEWAYKGCYKAAEFQLEASSTPPIAEVCETIEKVPEAPAEAPLYWALQPDPPVDEPMDVPEPPADPFTGWGVPAEAPVADPPDQGWGAFTPEKKVKKGKPRAKTKPEMKEAFISRKHSVRRDMISPPPTRANRNANENYTEIFLCHARLYVFAEKYDIQPLKLLALEELHDTLAVFTLYHKRSDDIIALLRYVYANTGESARGGDGMRKLLRDYVGFEMDVLMKNAQFESLMIEDGGPLVADFMKMVIKRIS